MMWFQRSNTQTAEKQYHNLQDVDVDDFRLMESGQRDGRIVPVAVCLWCCLIAVAQCGEDISSAIGWCASTSGACWLGTMVWMLARVSISARECRAGVWPAVKSRLRQLGKSIAWYGVILGVTACAAGLLGTIMTYQTIADPVVQTLREGSQQVAVTMHVGMMKVSWKRSFDCMMTVPVSSIEHNINGEIETATLSDTQTHLARIVEPSHAKMTVFASGQLCHAQFGQTVRVSGTLRAPTFGSDVLWRQVPWLEVKDDDRASSNSAISNSAISDSANIDTSNSSKSNGVAGQAESGEQLLVLSQPTWLERAQQRVRESFLVQTRQFGTQSAVLIPGLTMGLLGDDAYLDTTGQALASIDTNEAQTIQRLTTDAGIVHLMAVSGGHVAIIMAMVVWAVRRLRCNRLWTWVIVLCALAVLQWVMVPAASLDRALAMTALGATAGVQGKPSNTVSALAWTTVLMLILNPSLACDLGFALSCSATAAIIALASPLTERLHRYMPQSIAQALALTISAQCGTTPISVLINPHIPLAAPLANILATPSVCVVTLSGLFALAVAWCAPWLAHLSLMVAAAGCDIIVHGAKFALSMPISILPWESSITSAVSLTIMLWLWLAIYRISKLWLGLSSMHSLSLMDSPSIDSSSIGKSSISKSSIGVSSIGSSPIIGKSSLSMTPWQRAVTWWQDTLSMMKPQ